MGVTWSPKNRGDDDDTVRSSKAADGDRDPSASKTVPERQRAWAVARPREFVFLASVSIIMNYRGYFSWSYEIIRVGVRKWAETARSTPPAAAHASQVGMGCAGSKSSEGAKDATAEAVDVHVLVGKEDRTTSSAIKGGEQSREIRERGISISFQSKELKKVENEQLAPPQQTVPVIEQQSTAPFELEHIGTATLHGVMPGPKGTKAKINQDRGVICWPFCGSYNEALLCVFDGHGSRGEKASEFCMKQLPELLEAEHEALLAEPSECLVRCFLKLDELLRTDSPHKRFMDISGTTGNVLYMRGTDIWVASVGDSRAIKASRDANTLVATDLSVDHKLELPEERARIEQAGGEIQTSGGSCGTPPRARSMALAVNSRLLMEDKC